MPVLVYRISRGAGALSTIETNLQALDRGQEGGLIFEGDVEDENGGLGDEFLDDHGHDV